MAATAFFVNNSQEPIYQATSVLLISEGTATSDGNDFQALQLSERLAQSYIERLTNYEVLAETITNLGLRMAADDLQEAINVRLINNTQLIALSVENSNPQIATALANEIPQTFAERNMTMQLERFANSKANLETELTQIKEDLAVAETALTVEQNRGNEQAVEQLTDNVFRLRETHSRLLQSYEDIRIAEAGNLNNLIIDEHARVPQDPIRPRTLTNTLLAGVVGVLLAVGTVFLVEYLDDTIKDPDILEQATGLSTMGLIAEYSSQDENEALVMVAQPRSPIAEAYRQVRTNVQYVSVSRDLSTILVSSANVGEGKSTTAANLAIALAQANSKVILVDSDMRRPVLHHKFGLSNSTGLTTLLLSKENDTAFLQETNITNLWLIPSGPTPPNPAELIHSERMKQVIHWLHENADYVIVDSPPILAVTDSVLLSQIASTTLMVIQASETSQQSLIRAIQQIRAVDGHIAGVLFNKVDLRRSSYYYNDYYRSNDYYYATGEPSSKKRRKLGVSLPGFLTFILSLLGRSG